MGKRGPAPKPTNVRVLHGDRKDRINTDEPVPAEGDVLPPAWLADDALEVWEDYAGDLEDKGVLTPWDCEAFANWCDSVVRRRRAATALAKEGEVIDLPVFDKNGEETGSRRGKNPWVLVLDSADAQVQRYGARFGMTPSDRAQIKIKAKDSGLGAERLLS